MQTDLAKKVNAEDEAKPKNNLRANIKSQKIKASRKTEKQNNLQAKRDGLEEMRNPKTETTSEENCQPARFRF
ncbi:MAG: hypothetical protein IPM31_13790 [Anaerolineae bacterium]|nr:hypothetical protein [Anaerolineae bacterium]